MSASFEKNDYDSEKFSLSKENIYLCTSSIFNLTELISNTDLKRLTILEFPLSGFGLTLAKQRL